MTTATHIPEILHEIAHYLDPPSYFTCTKVCLQWKQLFSPYLWHTVDATLPPFNRLFNRPGKTDLSERRHRLEMMVRLLKEFGGFVRELAVTDNTVLLAAVEAGLGRLEGVRFRRVRFQKARLKRWKLEEEFWWERKCLQDTTSTLSISAVKVLDTCPWEDVIPRSVIRQLYQGSAARTRATWFLIRSNPGLVRLSFHKSWSNLKFENDHKPFHPPNQGLYTTPQSMWMSDKAESFLQEMFSTHIPELRHLEMGHGIEGSLLNVLGKFLPKLESFVQSERVCLEGFAVRMLHEEAERAPHGSLRRLVVKGEVSEDLVRGYVKAFPRVREIEFQGVPRPTPEEEEEEEEEDDDNYEGVPWLDYGFNDHNDGDGDGINSEEDNSNSTTATDVVTFPRNAVLEWPSVESITISPYKPDPYDLAKFEKRRTWVVGGRLISPLSPFIENLGGLLDALVRFQGVTHFSGSITLPSADMFRQLLWTFPALTRVECSSQGRGEIFITDTLGGDDYDIEQHPIQELILRHNIGIGSSQDAESLFFQMPHLVNVEIHGYELDGAAVLEIVRNCRRLRRVWFDLKKPDDYYEVEGGSSLSLRAMVDILVESPETLKSLRGRGHIVLVQDLVESREWGCKEMEELDIEIFGVPRLTKVQEEVLDALSKLDPGIVAKQQQQQQQGKDVDTAEQIRRRLQQLGHGDGLTSAEVEALDRRLVSYAVQRKVYQRLGELTQLKRLTFGRWTEYLSRITPARLDTLEFSLASGLAELEILDHIASYTDTESHLTCTYVCRDWRRIFQRRLWRTVNPCLSPYKQIFACSGSEGDRRHHIAALLRRHKEYIRHLTVIDNAVLLAALDSNLTDLFSLTMVAELNTRYAFPEKFSKNLIGVNPSASNSGSNRWKTAVQREAFASGYRRGELDVLGHRGYWCWKILDYNTWCSSGTGKYWTSKESAVYFNPVTIQLAPRPELKRLIFQGGIDIRQLRSLVVAFPNLRHLSIPQFKDKEDKYSDDDVDAEAMGVSMGIPMVVLEYPSLESLVFDDGYGRCGYDYGNIIKLLTSRIRLPRIKEVKSYTDIVGPSVVRQTLWMFPALKALHCWSTLSETASIVEENKEEAAIHPIRVLNLYTNESHIPGLYTTITRMPFLVKLCIQNCAIDRRTLSSIVKSCKSLERLYFNLQEGDGREMADLLVGGATSLKSCLEKLDVEVFGVPRPTREQEKLLEKLWALDPSWFRATTDGATAVAELRDVELEQARERLQQVGYELTQDEAEALEQRRVSHTIQRKVYRRLGCLTQLQQISFISRLDPTTGRQERFDGLEFNLMCSLGGQAILDHVKAVCFSQPKPAINEADYK
ncbi:hypothetical protein EC957_006189 [Mortierella hygrophila]|uniref:F-box domain-containing protein n=1 Tax=Mortierella hygrophila TaxID=979708 RepID=A0A9P6JYR4_9FUNG|nr:hypothetical protein EC957_006189 [Mortierella hygrophila]